MPHSTASLHLRPETQGCRCMKLADTCVAKKIFCPLFLYLSSFSSKPPTFLPCLCFLSPSYLTSHPAKHKLPISDFNKSKSIKNTRLINRKENSIGRFSSAQCKVFFHSLRGVTRCFPPQSACLHHHPPPPLPPHQ